MARLPRCDTAPSSLRPFEIAQARPRLAIIFDACLAYSAMRRPKPLMSIDGLYNEVVSMATSDRRWILFNRPRDDYEI